jgi:NAD(P)H-dependent flavin oxidoreductase YrpB (nitropropane dioxygenase family)
LRGFDGTTGYTAENQNTARARLLQTRRCRKSLGRFRGTLSNAIVSGFEAGGHRGSFLRAREDSLSGTFSHVPQIVDRVNVPVIAAGGIPDSRGVIAALALGAEAIQIGTAFPACEESGAGVLHREALRGRKAGHTALTKGFTGRLAREIHNGLVEELNKPGTEILPYPLQRGLLEASRQQARRRAGRTLCLCRPGKVPIFRLAPTYRVF